MGNNFIFIDLYRVMHLIGLPCYAKTAVGGADIPFYQNSVDISI